MIFLEVMIDSGVFRAALEVRATVLRENSAQFHLRLPTLKEASGEKGFADSPLTGVFYVASFLLGVH